MNKITVMVEKEIDIEELTTCLRHQLTQDGAYDAALVIETLYKQIEELEQHCDTFKNESEELKEQIKKIKEVQYEVQYMDEAKYLYKELTKRGVKLARGRSIGTYICAALNKIDTLIDETEQDKLQNKIDKLQKENEILRKCVPSCIGSYDPDSLIDCGMCQHCEECEELTNA